MIILNNISKSFDDGKTLAVENVSLEVQEGETLVILGSSGSGKTTLLKMINRLLEPSAGEIYINDQNVREMDLLQLRRSIGYVFQDVGLFPHLSVEENISIVLRSLGQSSKIRHCRAEELLSLVNLDPTIYAKRYPAELSGGQQQRVGLARALAADPHYLLMDEPFAALDSINRHDLQSELLHLKKSMHKTTLFVTHDIFEAFRMGDRIAVMQHGKLEQVGSRMEILRNPATHFVRQLFSKVTETVQNFLEVTE